MRELLENKSDMQRILYFFSPLWIMYRSVKRFKKKCCKVRMLSKISNWMDLKKQNEWPIHTADIIRSPKSDDTTPIVLRSQQHFWKHSYFKTCLKHLHSRGYFHVLSWILSARAMMTLGDTAWPLTKCIDLWVCIFFFYKFPLVTAKIGVK